MDYVFSIYYQCSPFSMENRPKFIPDPKLRLMDQLRQILRYHHYAYRTERTYCDWIIRFIRFYGTKTHPKQICKKQEFTGHADVKTTKIHTHIMQKNIDAVTSPVDQLDLKLSIRI